MNTASFLEQSHTKNFHQPPRQGKTNPYFSKEHLLEIFKHEFMWFVFQEILTFMRNDVNPQSDYLLFQSITTVFYLFKIKVQFYGDKL